MARPKKAPQERSTEQVSLRLSPVELAKLRERADHADTTVTAFVRAAALGKRVTVQKTTAPDFMTRNELRRVGVNLNQIARVLNAGGTANTAKLDELCDKLDTLFDGWLEHGSESSPSRPQL